MKLARQSFLVAGLFLAAACGNSSSNGPDEYQAAVPTFSGVSAEVSGASSEGASLTASGGAEAALIAPAPGAELQASTTPDWLPKIRDAIKSLNQGLKDAFAPVEQLVLTSGPTQVRGQVYTYGPYDQNGDSYLLSVVRVAGNHYGWRLQVKKTGDADSAYVGFAAGTTFKATGDGAHRGRGTIGIDLDAYKTVVTTFPGQGKLFVAFSHHGFGPAATDAGVTGQSKTLIYGLRKFSADTTRWQPVDAVFYAHKNGLSGVTSVRVASYADIPEIPNDTPAKELLVGRARYNPGVGGRAEVAIIGGDLAGKVFFGAECWDKAEALVFKATALCTLGEEPGTGSCTWTTSGNEAACDVVLATGMRDHADPSDQNDPSPDPDAPANDVPGVPTQMPTGDGN
ncbi:MAG TPA: hypothetical protein VMT11_11645 [Myxococcaceae bacterium]|nr:hypothetical protein [Myxococcaceae bacterium]